ncbi:aromatic amino acid lyase [PVC group bacterium]|nr:aromatic amino acid lyase [PVC group bacterium]
MLEINGHKLKIENVWDVSQKAIKTKLSDDARVAMRESRALVEKLAGESRAVYGINTGFGPLSGTRVDPKDLRQHQINLLHHLSVGQGPLFSARETRAIMLVRANALARGFSGIREEVVDLLLACLNNDILPEIPSEGSVGASGDLVPLAHMARLLTGLGHVRADSVRMTAEEALAKHNLKPVVLECKEGLALVNGTSVMTALAALATREGETALSWMELLSSCCFQVLSASPEVLCSQLHKARGFRGQSYVATRIAEYLSTHEWYKQQIEGHKWGSHAKPVEPGIEIQDSYSIRCTPQVLGAFQEALWHVQEVVTRELNASTDNPLIFPEMGSVIHGGNFYGQQISMVSDYLRLGLIKMGLFSERQLDRLMNWRYSMGLSPLLAGGEPGLNSGMAGCQLLATSLAAECRILGTPASIQTIPTNANNQDVVSMGCIAAKMTNQVLPKLWTLTAIEALALSQAAEQRDEGTMGKAYQALHDKVREISPSLKEDRPLFEDIKKISSMLQSEEAQNALLNPRKST